MDAPSKPTSYIRLLPAAVALIAVVTAASAELAHPLFDRDLGASAQPVDIVRNILLYMPLGIALRRSLFRCIAIAAALSVAAELLQLFYPDRATSAIDVGANMAGAMLGAIAAGALRHMGWRFDSIRLTRLGGLAAIVVCVAFIVVLSRARYAADFSNWDPHYQLAVGNELSGDYPWDGEILEMAILAAPVERAVLRQMWAGGPGSIQTFVDRMGEEPLSSTARVSPTDARWGRPLLDGVATKHLFDALVPRSTMSLLVWFQTGRARQEDTARIVTFSRDARDRNFTLGHKGRRLVFRLRTPRTGRNGVYPETVSHEILEADRALFAAATYDGGISRVYLDGRLVARQNIAARGHLVPFLADSGLPAVAALAGALATAGVMGIARRRLGIGRWLVAAIGGLAASAALIVSGAAGALPGFTAWVPVFGVAGGLVIAAAYTRPD